MKPVVFDGCFGWLHPAEGRHGVVLCNPFGYDALCTHRGWRLLAERLAAAGMPTLRFDYPGTGDSLGREEDPGRVEAWLASIGDAMRFLRASSGVEQISLCGLALGATLAALAAQRAGDVDGLVLLGPALSGKNYVRALRAHRQSWLSTPAGMNAAPIADTDRYVEAFGFGLHGDDIERLAGIDVRRDTQAPARRVLLLDSTDRTRAAALADHYVAHGVAVERQPFDESDKFLVEALYSEPPAVAFDTVLKWFAETPALAPASALASTSATTDESTPEPVAQQRDSGLAMGEPMMVEPVLSEPVLTLSTEGAIERAVVFENYFGIHCQPDVPRAGAPAVLFVNTGASHHIGDGRIFVLFARRLAAEGIASLRMDLGELGDSTPVGGQVTLDKIYAPQAAADALAGIDWLAKSGHARVVTFGVCGGAFVGLHASALDARIMGCYGVNLQKFIWDGEARTPGTEGLASTRVLRQSAFQLEKWKQVLRGETSLLRVIRGLAQRARRVAVLRAAALIEARTGWVVVRNEAHRLLARLHAKETDVRLVYGDFDLGLDELKIQFGAHLTRLRGLSSITAMTLPKLDHALFTREAREAVMIDAQQWLAGYVNATSGAQSVEGRSTANPPDEQHAFAACSEPARS